MGYCFTSNFEGDPAVCRKHTRNLQTGLRSVESGLRFYNPDTGRWLNRDPSNEHGGLSLYASFYNDPVSVYDAFGLKGCCKCIKVESSLVTNPPYKFVSAITGHEGSKVQFHFGVDNAYTIKTTGGDGCKCQYFDEGYNTFNGIVDPIRMVTDIDCVSGIDSPGYQPVIDFAPPHNVDTDIVISINLIHGITCTSSDGSTLSAIGQTMLPPTRYKIRFGRRGIRIENPPTIL